MKREYIYISAAALVGVAVGIAIGIFAYKKKEASTEVPSEPEKESEESETEEAENDFDGKELYFDRIRDLEYKSEAEDISYEEEGELENYHDNAAAEEYRKENYGKIEILTRKEWEKHLYQEFSDVEYSADDLYYFPDTDWLTDEFGGVLEPQEKYTGDCLTKFNFKGNDEEELYVRNHPYETDFAIHKIIGQSRDEYFEDN